MSEESFKPVGLGPKGGDLSTPTAEADPMWRIASLQTPIMANGERGLHRFLKDHDTAIPGQKNERPWHRMAAYMLNAGRTNSEIALAADVNPDTVSHLRAQRWFQELCATIANESGEEIVGAINSYALDAIEEIATLMRSSESDSVRLNAARTLVEQAHGKPTQKIISSVSHSRLSAQDEMEQLDQELRALQSPR